MANFNLTINSKFQPFSFERYIQPLQMYGQAYREQEDALAELNAKASIWEGLANKETDRQAYEQYKRYAEDLRAQADAISRYGLDPSSRSKMLDLRARYSAEITPIENAYNQRLEDIKAQKQAFLNNPTTMFKRLASTVSLDDYINNPNMDVISDHTRGDLLATEAANMAKAWAQRLASYGRGNDIDDYTTTFLQDYGISPDAVQAFLTNPNDPNANPVIRAISDQVMKSSGVLDWGDTRATNQAQSYINQGITQGIGKVEVAPMEKFYEREMLKHQLKLNEQEAAARLAGGGDGFGIGVPYTFDELFTGGDKEKKEHLNILTDLVNNKSIITYPSTTTSSKDGMVYNSTGLQSTYLYNKNKGGTIRNLSEYMAQGKDTQEKQRLKNHYINNILPDLQELGLVSSFQVTKDSKGNQSVKINWANGKVPTRKEANAALTKYKNTGAGGYRQKVVKYPTKDLKAFLGNMTTNADGAGGWYEIKGDLKDFRKGDRVKTEKLLDQIGENGTGTVHLSASQGKQGLIITTPKGQYFLPSNNLSITARDGFDNLSTAASLVKSKEDKIKDYKKALRKQYQGLTEEEYQYYAEQQFDASEVGQSLNQRIQTNFSSTMSNIGWGIEGYYNRPNTDIIKNTGKATLE